MLINPRMAILRAKLVRYLNIVRTSSRTCFEYILVRGIMSSITERLHTVRGRLSFRSFSEILGIPASTLRNYEQGDTSPTIETLTIMCEKMSISKSWLMFGEGPMQAEEGAMRQDERKPDFPSSYGEDRFAALEDERRELSAENRQLHRENAGLLKEIADLRERIARLEEQAIALKTQCKGGVMDTAVPASAPSAPSTNLNNDRA